MARLVRRIETLVPRRAEAYGGKVQGLAALARGGFAVPAAYAVSASVGRAELANGAGIDSQISLQRPMGARELERLAARVREMALSPTLERALADVLAELRLRGVSRVAVRSSSRLEDAGEGAAAGLFHTELGVSGLPALLEAIRACWASAFRPEVLSYVEGLGDGDVDLAMGVAIQTMVPAEISGVLFTVNPLTGDVGELVVNAAYGLGAPLVEGRLSPDTYRLDKATGGLRDRVLGSKEIRQGLGADGGLVELEVPPADRGRFALDDSMLAELHALGLRIEEHFGGARDVEWSVFEGSLFVLQSRPITTVSSHTSSGRATRRGAHRDRARTVWSNINVGEALPGVASPLTWSVLSAFSELGFRRAFGALGCTVPRDAELVGNFRGRIYLNMTEFMAIASQVPGLRPKTLLALGGGGEAKRLEDVIEERSSILFLARLPLTAARFGREALGLSQRVANFERYVAGERDRYASLDLRLLSPAALSKTLRDREQLLADAGEVLLTCYGNLLATVVALRSVLHLLTAAHAERLEQDLFSGLADVESAAPGHELLLIAEMARLEPAVVAKLLTAEPGTVRVEDLPAGPTRSALGRFFVAYGYRAVREAELMTPRWNEDSTLPMAALRQYVIGGLEGQQAAVAAEHRSRSRREAALAEIQRSLLPPLRLPFRRLVGVAQRHMRLRERLRARVSEILGLIRNVALDASRRIAAKEPTAGVDAAFFITIDEMHRLLRGELGNVTARVRQRRRQYERDVALPDPPDTFVGYPPAVPEVAKRSDALVGLPASPGKVVARARVLRSPSDMITFVAGEVLVAPHADVGWAPLFLVAGAVVTDLGGPLSHAAVVAREYGVPCVVNVKIATQVLRTGDLLEVDGGAGSVRVLRSASSVDGVSAAKPEPGADGAVGADDGSGGAADATGDASHASD